MKPSSSVLDYFLELLTKNPRNFFLFFFLLLGFFFNIMATLIACVCMMVGYFFPVLAYGFVSIGLLLMGLFWAVEGITLLDVYQKNHWVLQEMRHARFYFDDPYQWIVVLPSGFLLGGVLSWVQNMDAHLKKELKRIGKGKLLREGSKKTQAKRKQKALGRIVCPAIAGGSVLGVDQKNGQPVALMDVEANLHSFVLGTTGSGKTNTVCNLMESAILRKHPVIYVDGKGDVALGEALEQFCIAKNVPFKRFSLVGQSLKYNPLASGGFTEKKDRLIELRVWTEEHYKKIAEGYLQTVFSLLDRFNIPVDLVSLSTYLYPKPWLEMNRTIKDPEKNKFVQEKASYLKENFGNISSVVAEIQNLATSQIGALFDCTGVSDDEILHIEQIVEQGGVAYFCLQPLAFPAYAQTAGKLIINDIKAMAASRLSQKKTSPIFTVFDEFSVFAGDQIVNLINQGRSAGIHAVLSTQSVADIVRAGEQAFLDQILDNCNNYIIHRQNSPTGAELLGNVIGTMDTFEVTSQIATDQGSTGVGSVKQIKAFLYHPDTIKRLEQGEAIFVKKGTFDVCALFVRKSAIGV